MLTRSVCGSSETLSSLCWLTICCTVLCGSAILAQEDNTTHQVCDFNTDYESGSSSGDESGPTESSSLPECIKLNATNDRVFDICKPFMGNKCYLYDYGLNYEKAMNDLGLLNAALVGSSENHIQRDCWDVIRAFICNYYYIGCSHQTRLAQGICAESCAEYVEYGSCAPSFSWLVNFTVSIGSTFVFTPDCDNPLWNIPVQNPLKNNAVLDKQNCINMSDVVDNPIIMTTEDTPKQESVTESDSDSRDSIVGLLVGGTFAVATTIVIIVGALLIVLGVYIQRVKKQKKLMRRNMMENMSADRRSSLNNYGFGINHLNHHRRSVVSIGEYDSVGKFTLSPEDISLLGEDLKNALIPFDKVKITGDLGEGAFGCVYKGILTKDTEYGLDEIGVAIKTIKNHSAYHEMKDFLTESSIMCSFSHPNVLGMEGICLDPESQSPYLILPFMKNGDLKSYLRKKRSICNLVDVSYPEGLNHETLLGMCYQISCGMEYLASRKLVHRDLAARNCMIDRDNSVKVADFGLTRDIYQKDYYRQSSRGQIPVKWMAPESLVDRISNEKTDVWSFGVTCWEVFSLGRVPYPTIANSEVVDYLMNGKRLQKPTLCQDKVYEVMLLCWKDDGDNRPSFENIVEMIQNILINTDSQSNGPRPKGGRDSYVLISDLSSSGYTDYDGQTLFSNGSLSFDCDGSGEQNMTKAHTECYESRRQSHTPSVPSPLLHSTSYDTPHSITMESSLHNNNSISSATSIYLDMAPTTPVKTTLMTLEECDSPND